MNNNINYYKNKTAVYKVEVAGTDSKLQENIANLKRSLKNQEEVSRRINQKDIEKILGLIDCKLDNNELMTAAALADKVKNNPYVTPEQMGKAEEYTARAYNMYQSLSAATAEKGEK
jgi:hypothetical protein